MVRKKIFHRWIYVTNWVLFLLGAIIIVLLLPPFKVLVYRDILLFFLSFISLIVLGLHIVMAGAAGVLYKDIASFQGIFTSGRSKALRGRRATQTGWMYVLGGCLFIGVLLYTLFNAVTTRDRIERENKSNREQFMQQYLNTQQQDPPEQPPHFMPR